MTYPIILAHGVCRFDQLWSSALHLDNNDDPRLDQFHYFKGLRTYLKSKGFSVYHANVGWADAIQTRAEQLRHDVLRVLERENADKVNIIAHSMGGLDARHMLFNYRDTDHLEIRVASLTTISTPHEGSPFADWGAENLPHFIPIAQKIGLRLEGLNDLRTSECRAFNNDPQVVAFEASCEGPIRFQTFAGIQNFVGVIDVLKLPFYIIEKAEGENDGLVSVRSGKWRDRYFKGVIRKTDHFNELGWWDPGQLFELEGGSKLLKRVHRFYLEIAQGLP